MVFFCLGVSMTFSHKWYHYSFLENYEQDIVINQKQKAISYKEYNFTQNMLLSLQITFSKLYWYISIFLINSRK